MDLPLSRALVPRLDWLPEVGSTNDVLVQGATGASASAWPELSVVASDNQVAGRGRLGRSWSAPAGRSLAVSVLLRPRLASGAAVPPDAWGLLPLIAGLAMTRAVRGALPGGRSAAGAGVGLKWPNDVLIGEDKVSGILGELLPDGAGLVMGAGVNLRLSASELPTATSTSLELAGAGTGAGSGAGAVSTDAVLAAYLGELTALYRGWIASGADPVGSGVLEAATAASATLGRPVRVELPGGVFRTGTARALDASGRLVVDVAGQAAPLVVSAGDVTHLRHDDR